MEKTETTGSAIARRGMAWDPTRRRALDWLLVVVLTIAWVAVFVRSFDEGLRTGRAFAKIDVSSALAEDDYPFVVIPRLDLGIEAGDRIEAVESWDLRGRNAAHFYDRVHLAARERGFGRLRLSRAGTQFESTLPLQPLPYWWMRLPGSALGIDTSTLCGWHSRNGLWNRGRQIAQLRDPGRYEHRRLLGIERFRAVDATSLRGRRRHGDRGGQRSHTRDHGAGARPRTGSGRRPARARSPPPACTAARRKADSRSPIDR